MKAISSIKQNAHMNTHSSSTVAVPPPNQSLPQTSQVHHPALSLLTVLT